MAADIDFDLGWSYSVHRSRIEEWLNYIGAKPHQHPDPNIKDCFIRVCKSLPLTVVYQLCEREVYENPHFDEKELDSSIPKA